MKLRNQRKPLKVIFRHHGYTSSLIIDWEYWLAGAECPRWIAVRQFSVLSGEPWSRARRTARLLSGTSPMIYWQIHSNLPSRCSRGSSSMNTKPLCPWASCACDELLSIDRTASPLLATWRCPVQSSHWSVSVVTSVISVVRPLKRVVRDVYTVAAYLRRHVWHFRRQFNAHDWHAIIWFFLPDER